MLLVLSVRLPIVIAADTGTCAEGSAVYRFEGYEKDVASVAGAEAIFENQSLNVCTHATDNDRSNLMWVGVAAEAQFGDFNIFQAGIGRCVSANNADCNNNGTMEWWAWGRQHAAPGCGAVSEVPPVPKKMGNFPANNPKITLRKTSTQWQVQVDGTVVKYVTVGQICWPQVAALWTGESWDLKDAIGGPVDNPYRISSARWVPTVGGAWVSPAWGTGDICNLDSGAQYHCNAPVGSTIDVWTVQP